VASDRPSALSLGFLLTAVVAISVAAGSLISGMLPGAAPTQALVGETATAIMGDGDCDGGVDSVDALVVLLEVASLPNDLPPGCVETGAAHVYVAATGPSGRRL